MTAHGDRRRHPRLAAGVSARVEGARGALTGVVIDVSVGGVLLELASPADVPALGARARIMLERDGQSITRDGRVVRLRLAGRDCGRPMSRACAWVFDDGDEDAERHLARMIGPS
jgi:hypothetical protein